MVWKSRTCRVLAAIAGCSLSGAAFAQTQNFDSTAVGSLPSGWSTSSTGAGAPWAVVNNQSHSAPNSVFTNDVATVSSQYLTLPSIQSAGTVRIDFWKRFQTEATYDGFTVEVDINGGGFNNIGTAAFTLGAYNQAAISTAFGSAIGGQPAFSGAGLTWTESTALVSTNTGDVVTVRFNMSSDTSASSTGVWLDDISITSSSNFGACCDTLQGTCSLNTAALCTGSGITFQGAGSACPAACPPQGACCGVSGGCTLTGAAGCTGGATFQGGGSVCSPYPCPPPSNDECGSGNPVLVVGTPATGSNIGATQSVALTAITGDPFCGQTSFGTGTQNDVYWKFTPTVTATYNIDTCGSSFDTTLSIHNACPADDSNKLACNDDSTFNTGYPACGTGTNSRIPAIQLNAGTTYTIRVAGYNGGTGQIVLNAGIVNNGACCAASGTCTATLTGAAGCPSGAVYQGDNSSCQPNPCPQPPGANCSSAINVTLNNPVQGDLSSNSQTSTITCSSGVLGAWYSFTAPSTGSFLIDSLRTSGTGNPSLGVFTGDCSTQIACVNPCGGSDTQAVVSLNQGDTIHFRAGGCADTQLTWTLTITTTVVGACCNNTTGACTTSNTGSAGCASGTTYQGDNTACTSSPCHQEACCNALSGACTIAALGACSSGTTGQGDGTTCTPSNPCPQPPPPSNDECDASNPALTVGVQTSGANVFATTSTTLTGTLCPNGLTASGGANDVFFRFVAPATTDYTIDTCGSSFDTVVSIHSDCPATEAGLLACNDDAPTATACSNSGVNSRITSVSLTAGITYTVRVAGYNGATGAFNLLINYVNPPTGGVCCRGATCNTTLADAGACSGSLISGQTAGAAFISSATACNSGNATSPCCYANYNKTGGISVQDIFDFLNDWFAGSPYANVGGSGAAAPLAVQNIFDFLNAWFAGGCN